MIGWCRRRSLSPQETPTSNFILGGLRQPTYLQRGGVDSGHDKSRVFSPLFRAYWNHPTSFFPPSGPSSVGTPYFAHIFYSWLSCQIYTSHPFRGSGDRWVTRDVTSARTRARLVTLRSLNWPDNYDELSSPQQTAVRAALDKKFTEYLLAVNSAAHAASQQAVANYALINAGTTTNSTDTPVKATKPGTEASLANPIDLTTPEGSPVAPTRLFPNV